MKKHAIPGASIVFEEPWQESQRLSRHIAALAAVRGKLSILEAGCGNSWHLELPEVRYELTGIDVNANALNIRKNQHGDLDRAILGDLRTADLDENTYDVIYNSFVLEHVNGAEYVLDNLRRWLSPGGILILRIPDPRSVYGLFARLTPFWLHVFYKRFIAGVKTAGKEGYDPFPTVYDAIVSRSGIHTWCLDRGLTMREEIAWNFQIARPGIVSVLVRKMIRMTSILSLGQLAADHVNLTYVIEKPQGTSIPRKTLIAEVAP
jgi:SAM-dependent methyltransferase